MQTKSIEERYTEYLNTLNIHLLRSLARAIGVSNPTTGKKDPLIARMIDVLTGVTPPVPPSTRGAPLRGGPIDAQYINELSSIRAHYVEETASADDLTQSQDAQARSAEVEVFESRHRTGIKRLVEELPDGKGVLRGLDFSVLPDEASFPVETMRKYALRDGDLVECTLKKQPNGMTEVREIYAINKMNWRSARPYLDDLFPCFPEGKIEFCPMDDQSAPMSLRCLELFAPVAKGQRVLVSAPTGTQPLHLLYDIAASVNANKEPFKLMVLLTDEPPEEVARFQKSFIDAEIAVTTFSDEASEILRKAKLFFSRAARLAEDHNDVVILVDSLTKLVQAANAEQIDRRSPNGLGANAIITAKRWFSLARKTELYGSITIFGVVSGDENAADEQVCRELNTLANSHIVLSRSLMEEGFYPPLDVKKTYTDRSPLNDEQNKLMEQVRMKVRKMNSAETLGVLCESASNKEFLLG